MRVYSHEGTSEYIFNKTHSNRRQRARHTSRRNTHIYPRDRERDDHCADRLKHDEASFAEEHGDFTNLRAHRAAAAHVHSRIVAAAAAAACGATYVNFVLVVHVAFTASDAAGHSRCKIFVARRRLNADPHGGGGQIEDELQHVECKDELLPKSCARHARTRDKRDSVN